MLAKREVWLTACISVGKMPTTYTIVVFQVAFVESKGLDPFLSLGSVSGKAMHGHTSIFGTAIPTNNTYPRSYSNSNNFGKKTRTPSLFFATISPVNVHFFYISLVSIYGTNSRQALFKVFHVTH